MRLLLNDVRLAARQFRRQPRLPLAVVSTLGLAIGMNVAVFSVVHAVMFRALPFAAPGRVVWIASVRTDNPAAPFTLPEFVDYRARARTLSGLAAYANWSASLEGQGITERLQGARMSANSFAVLGVSASAGRLLRESDDEPGAPAVAVLSHRLWQRQFGGGADVVGRPLRINGEPFVIVGILPRHFPLPLQGIDVVIPLVPDRDPLRLRRNSVNFLRLFGRLDDGMTDRQAEAELTSICLALREQFPKEYARKVRVRAIPFHDALVGEHRQSMFVLLGAVAVVLGAALANLVALMLIRTNDRRTELCIRVALGASRVAVLRLLAVEAALMAIAGGAAGWLFAVAATGAAAPWLPASIPRLDEVGVDWTVMLFALVLIGVTTLLLGVAPLGGIIRAGADGGLRLQTRGATGDRSNRRARHVLVVVEIATAVVVLLVTTLLAVTVQRLQDVKPGFDPDGVFQAHVSLPAAYQSPEAVSEFYERLSARLAAQPGVQAVGVISVAPLSGLLATVPFSVAGAPVADARDKTSANLRVVTPGYLSAAGTRLRQGRIFSETDRPDAPAVALVSAPLAERFLSPQPIGRQLLIDDNSGDPRPVDVIGVVEEVRQTALDAPATLDVYIPLRQIHPENVGLIRNNQFWMVRMATNPEAFRGPFLTELRAVDRDAATSSTGPMRLFVDAWFAPRRLTLALFGLFALTAVVLAVSGVYALISYTVSQRRREIGLRMAIGATQASVRRLILWQAARLLCAGLAAGLCVAALARPVVSRLAGGARLDWPHILLPAAAIAALVIAGAWWPARRASRIAPTLALRGE